MSSQSERTLPGVFEDSERIIRIDTWGNEISSNPYINKNCFVRRFTHVKNVASRLLHEYLNVIVVDESTNEWTRLIIERQTNQDQVTIGRWGAIKNYDEKWKPQDCFYQPYTFSSGSNYGSSGKVEDLPLPLITCSFKKRCFELKNLATMLQKYHDQHPKYNLAYWNCYWFSRCIFDGASVSKLGVVDHAWTWASWRGDKWKIPLVAAGYLHDKLKVAVDQFIELRSKFPLHGDPDSGQTDDFHITSITSSSTKYEDSMKEILHFLNIALLDELKKNPVDKAELERENKEYHNSIASYVEESSRLPDSEHLLEKGRRIASETDWKVKFIKDSPIESFSEVDLTPVLEGQDQLLVGPSKEERDALDRDLWIFLGYLDSKKVFE